MSDLWFEDIMLQNFINGDATRIIILFALTSDNEIKHAYRRKEILEYVYRTYVDNIELRNCNPNYKIREICKFGLNDIDDVFNNALIEWQSCQKNNSLLFDENYIYLNNISIDESTIKYTRKLALMLNDKYIKVKFSDPVTINKEILIDDKNLDVFGQSKYKDRVFEDIQYCPLCEEIDREKLRVVHILSSCNCNDNELYDKNNGLIMCEKHANDYNNHDFYFDEKGYVHNVKSLIIEKNMHLSQKILNGKRKEYIKKAFLEK